MKETTVDQLLRLFLAVTAPRSRDERGDVPGWVMVTILTVALAITIFSFVETPLQDLLNRAFESVKAEQ